MIRLLRTDSHHVDFIRLVENLDAYLAEKDGMDHAFYHQFNQIADIKYVVIAYEGQVPVGCGAIKEFDNHSMEVKRMYVSPENRGNGIASRILEDLEQWTAELGGSTCILETGKRQPEAIKLYEKSGYTRIQNYGQYAGMENSVCFEKNLQSGALRQ